MPKKKKSPSKKTPKAQAPKQPGKPGPVAQVWTIATKLGPKAERKAVIAACEKAGVNSATAATQYYRWKHATPAQRTLKESSLKEAPGKEKTETAA